MKAWRDIKTGEYVSEETYSRSRARGGTRYEEVNEEQGEPDQIFGSLDAFEAFYDDYDGDFEEYYYDGGIDYGEE